MQATRGECGPRREGSNAYRQNRKDAVAGEEKEWKTYEEVAVYLLNQIASELGLERVEGKQDVYGSRSLTKWEIDGKGVEADGEGFVIIECRRYTTSKQNQEKVAALAYRIKDAGANRGILVSPLGFQEGANKVAAAEGIVEVLMDANSTHADYMLRFLNKVFVGASDVAAATEGMSVTVIPTDEAGESSLAGGDQ
jgi:restriction endonuclease